MFIRMIFFFFFFFFFSFSALYCIRGCGVVGAAPDEILTCFTHVERRKWYRVLDISLPSLFPACFCFSFFFIAVLVLLSFLFSLLDRYDDMCVEARAIEQLDSSTQACSCFRSPKQYPY